MGITSVGGVCMNQNEIIEKINNLEKEISLLPPGSITKKTVKGNVYYYHRTTQNKKRVETFVDFDKLEDLQIKIDKRKLF